MIAPAPARAEVEIEIPLTAGWEMAPSTDSTIPATFIPAHVPGTVASALREYKTWRMGDEVRFDESNHWFRCRFDAARADRGEEIILRMGGIATLAEVWLNGQSILNSSSMFASHELNVSALLREQNELLIACRSLSAALREKRGVRPAARWRTRVVNEQQLRWFRTTLLGRAPGFSPEPEPVGPWRPIALLCRRKIVLEQWSRKIEMEGSVGAIAVDLQLRLLDPSAAPISGRLLAGGESASLEFEKCGDDHHARATLRIPQVVLWWPHTHGEPALYPVRAELELADGSRVSFEDVPAGFRTIDPVEPAGDAGFKLILNGTPVFCRGVVWTPPDIVTLAASEDVLRERLRLLRDGGFNLIRLAGTTIYESEIFHRLCDEMGLLVWQDMMFANMDYPFEDPDFRGVARAESEAELKRLSRHASTAAVCGNSEIEQQAGMLGLNAALGRGPFFGEELPRIAARCCPGVPYVPSAPCGGDQPFRTNRGVANYFGIGAYLRPLEDVRRAEVKFASECLAFANVPEPEMFEKTARKRGVPRDLGAGWDFEDVRDHYLKLLYSVDPMALRYAEPSRYWELSRMVSGEVMAEVFGEWRREASGCSGGIVLWSADLAPGAGWGILDAEGHPKAAYWFLKRAFAPQSVWMTDEGLNGIDVHAANDRPVPMNAFLRVALYRRGEHKIAEAEIAIAIPAHRARTFGVEQILGRFVDAAYAYRFGPPGHDLIVSSLHARSGDVPLAQSFRFPAGRSTQRAPIVELGIAAESKTLADGTIEILLRSTRFAWGVRVAAPGFLPDDAYFGIEPGGRRRVVLTPVDGESLPPKLVVSAVNAEGRLPV